MSTIQHKLLKAHVALALALADELGRRPTDAELQLQLRVLAKALAALEQPQPPAHRPPGHRGGRPC